MKKSRTKGFTLIELLAVIVILAVIALIATPIIMNVINDSKEGSAKDSMYGYVKAVELSTINTVTATTDAPDGVYKTTNGDLLELNEILNVNFKGTKPKDGGYVVLKNGQVTNAGLEFDGYCIKYDGSKADVSKDCSVPRVYIEGDIIYYNPETNKKCASTEVNTTVNAKTGCLKWNVITVEDTTSKTTIDIMLDHNTTATVSWNSTGTNAEMKEVATALQTDVTTWNASVKSTARLITGQEVANIVKNTNWTTGGMYISLSSQSWLWEYTDHNGDNTTGGYWTSTAKSSSVNDAWNVYAAEALRADIVTDGDNVGVRPVITISKSVIS